MTSQLGLEPRITAAKVIEAFYKYAMDTDDTPRQTATRIGVPIKTLRTWLEGQAQPHQTANASTRWVFKTSGIHLNLDTLFQFRNRKRRDFLPRLA